MRAAWAIGASCAAALVLGAVAGRAQSADARVALAWSAPAGCPDEASVRAAVARWLAGSAAERVEARATVTRAGDRYRVVVAMGGGERRLEADTCRELGDATALIVAMAADPARVMANRAEDAGADASMGFDASSRAVIDDAGADASDAAVIAIDAAPSFAPLVDAAIAPPPPPVPVVAPVDAGPALEPAAFAIGASAAVDVGALPAAAFSPSITAVWLPGPLRLDVAAMYLAPASSTPNAHGASVSVHAFAASARGCYVVLAPPFELAPCAVIEAASLSASSAGVTRATDRGSLLFAVGASAHVALEVAGPLALTLRADLLAPTIRPDFQVDGASLHKVGAPLGRAGGGVELRF